MLSFFLTHGGQHCQEQVTQFLNSIILFQKITKNVTKIVVQGGVKIYIFSKQEPKRAKVWKTKGRGQCVDSISPFFFENLGPQGGGQNRAKAVKMRSQT